MHGGHHPWRRFRALVDWTLNWAHLPGGLVGVTDFVAKTITLDLRLGQAERRCTIDHETEHAIRGPVPPGLRAREELRVCRISAQRLLPDVVAIADALIWADWCLREAAEELWVDEATLLCRLESMTHPAERAYMERRFEERC